MRVRHDDVKEEHFESPEGGFGITFRQNITCEETGCPFDLEHVILAPGKKNFPFHTHGSMWEMYYVLSGSATMRTDKETVDLHAGDTYVCAPGLAHQIINNTEAEFVYLVMSDDPPYDACYYPDSRKLMPRATKLWGEMPETNRFWQPLEGAEYFTGEE